jgi:hypothetical protein
MGQSKGYGKTTITVKIETMKEIDAICEEMNFIKQIFLTQALDYIASKTKHELKEIYHGKLSSDEWREVFRRQVLEVLEEKPTRQSGQSASHPAKSRRSDTGD